MNDSLKAEVKRRRELQDQVMVVQWNGLKSLVYSVHLWTNEDGTVAEYSDVVANEGQTQGGPIGIPPEGTWVWIGPPSAVPKGVPR